MKQDAEIRIIVDTNLWISFLIGRKLACLLDVLSMPNVSLVVCRELMEEVQAVASRPKFSKYFTEDKLSLLWNFMKEESLNFQLETVPSRCRDPKDDYLLELAVMSEADFLLTGDRDLLDLKKVASCEIVTVLEFEAIASSLTGCDNVVLHEDFPEIFIIQ